MRQERARIRRSGRMARGIVGRARASRPGARSAAGECGRIRSHIRRCDACSQALRVPRRAGAPGRDDARRTVARGRGHRGSARRVDGRACAAWRCAQGFRRKSVGRFTSRAVGQSLRADRRCFRTRWKRNDRFGVHGGRCRRRRKKSRRRTARADAIQRGHAHRHGFACKCIFPACDRGRALSKRADGRRARAHARIRVAVRQRARAVRTPDRQVPGDPAPARGSRRARGGFERRGGRRRGSLARSTR